MDKLSRIIVKTENLTVNVENIFLAKLEEEQKQNAVPKENNR